MNAPTAAQIAKHYDRLDEIYRAVWGPHVHHGFWIRGTESLREATEQLIAAVAAPLNLRAGESVCDVGCGYGATARFLANAFDVHVTGMTLSSRQFSSSEKMVNVDLLQGDFLENQFDDAQFDAAILIESLEHFADSRRLLDELRRILRPGGRLAMTAWLMPRTARPLVKGLILEPLRRDTCIHALTDERVLRADLEIAGFEDICVVDITREVRPTWPHITAGFLRALLTRQEPWAFLASDPRRIAYALDVLRMHMAFRIGGLRYAIVSARQK